MNTMSIVTSSGPAARPRYRLIACEIPFRECAAAMAECSAVIDPEFLPKGLHDMGEAIMSERIQVVIDAVDPEQYDAILLAYGLCNYGTRGLHARLPIVLPRAHDCITLLLGSRQRYSDYFSANPGTFFKSPGWIERDADPNASPASITSRLGISHDRAALVEQYGEENADFLMESMGDWLHSYRKLAFIDTGVGHVARYKAITESLAREKDWEVEHVTGSRALIDALCSGNWPTEDFLVLSPGDVIDASWDEAIVCPRKAALAAQEKSASAPNAEFVASPDASRHNAST